MKVIALLYMILVSSILNAQDLMNMIDGVKDSSSVKSNAPVVTFKSTRIVNFHTVELSGKNTLEFRISHRFGEVGSGSYQLWGLDEIANVRLALEYTPTKNFQLGIGRSSYQKQLDGFLKARILK